MSEQRQFTIPRWIYYALAAACCLTFFALYATLCTSSDGQSEGQKELRAPVNFASLPYEERLDAPIEEGVKRIDYAILKAVQDAKIPFSNISLIAIEQQKFGDETFHFQQLRITSEYTAEQLETAIAASLIEWSDKAHLARLAPNLYRISLHDVETHLLRFQQATGTATPDSDAASTDIKGHLTIVLDDLGENVSAAHSLASLEYPVTFAIWPQSSYTREIAKVATSAGREIIVHQPMEPISPDANPGPGAVYDDMTADDIRATLRANIKRIPEAIGLNNHMGSKVTQNRSVVQPVVEELKAQKLLVLDSMTHAKSVFFNEAKRQGLIAFRRNVFIDNVKEVQNILHQLKKAERIALAKGNAIAIGHPHPTTLLALQEWEKQRDKRVAIVTLSELMNF